MTEFTGLIRKENGGQCTSWLQCFPILGKHNKRAAGYVSERLPRRAPVRWYMSKQNQFCLLHNTRLLDLFCSSRDQYLPRLITGRERPINYTGVTAYLKQFQIIFFWKSVKCYFKIVTAIEPKQLQVSECPKQWVSSWVCSEHTTETYFDSEGSRPRPWARSRTEKTSWSLRGDVPGAVSAGFCACVSAQTKSILNKAKIEPFAWVLHFRQRACQSLQEKVLAQLHVKLLIIRPSLLIPSPSCSKPPVLTSYRPRPNHLWKNVNMFNVTLLKNEPITSPGLFQNVIL